MKLSIAIIGKNNQTTLPALLYSLSSIQYDELIFVDTGSTDHTKMIAQQFNQKVKVFDFEWCDDFAAARNFAYAQCSGDWIMWVDTDDIVLNGEKITELISSVEKDKSIDAIVLPYQYIVDDDGNIINEQYRIRISKKDHFKWVGAVHEDLIAFRKLNRLYNLEVKIRHTAKMEEGHSKLLRNLAIIEKQLEKEKKEEKVDARTVLYYAHTLFGLNRWADARDAYISYTSVSGWEEDLYLAYIRLAHCDRELKAYNHSVESIQMAWSIEPLAPEAYIQLGQTYHDMGLYKKAIQAAMAAQHCPNQKYERLTTSFPMEYVWQPLIIKANSHLAINEYRDALVYFKELKEKNYKHSSLDSIISDIENTIQEEDTVKKYFSDFSVLQTEQEKVAFYTNIPLKYRSYPSIIKIRQSFDKKTTSTGKEVVIMCAHAYEEWTPESVKNGIGGSEEAVINQARELQKLGYQVTVYNTIQEAKEFDGVIYKPWWEFNPEDKTDYFIAWRHEFLFDRDINATKKYLWLHDIVDPYEYTPERLSRIDKIIVLSEFHRKNLPQIPDDTFYITSNGVDISLFEKDIERKPFKMIYTSSYDRGLEQLLEMWPEIKRQIPEATLDVYYGWGNFDERNRDNPERKLWKEKMLVLLSQKGVTEHGRASHKSIAKAMLSSSIWAYPTTWLETNCITGLKAQIAGCIPVVVNVGALQETVDFGEKLDINIKKDDGKKTYIDTLVKVIYNQNKYDREKMMHTMRQKYAWSTIAKNWSKDLFI